MKNIVLTLILTSSLINAQEFHLVLSPSVDVVVKAEDQLASGATIGSSGEIALKFFVGPLGLDGRVGLIEQPDITLSPLSFGGFTGQKYSLGATYHQRLQDPWLLSLSLLWGNIFGTYNNTVIQFYLPSVIAEPAIYYKKDHFLIGISAPLEKFFPRDIDYSWSLGIKANLGVYY